PCPANATVRAVTERTGRPACLRRSIEGVDAVAARIKRPNRHSVCQRPALDALTNAVVENQPWCLSAARTAVAHKRYGGPGPEPRFSSTAIADVAAIERQAHFPHQSRPEDARS